MGWYGKDDAVSSAPFNTGTTYGPIKHALVFPQQRLFWQEWAPNATYETVLPPGLATANFVQKDDPIVTFCSATEPVLGDPDPTQCADFAPFSLNPHGKLNLIPDSDGFAPQRYMSPAEVQWLHAAGRSAIAAPLGLIVPREVVPPDKSRFWGPHTLGKRAEAWFRVPVPVGSMILAVHCALRFRLGAPLATIDVVGAPWPPGDPYSFLELIRETVSFADETLLKAAESTEWDFASALVTVSPSKGKTVLAPKLGSAYLRISVPSVDAIGKSYLGVQGFRIAYREPQS